MDCHFEQREGLWTCTVCGYIYKRPIAEPPHRKCGPVAQREPVPQGPPGVGDHLHDMLERWVGPLNGCQSASCIGRFNALGPEGCREAFEDIVEWVVERAERKGWWIGWSGRAATVPFAEKLVARAIERATDEV